MQRVVAARQLLNVGLESLAVLGPLVEQIGPVTIVRGLRVRGVQLRTVPSRIDRLESALAAYKLGSRGA